jgi:hypothetical protein
MVISLSDLVSGVAAIFVVQKQSRRHMQTKVESKDTAGEKRGAPQ